MKNGRFEILFISQVRMELWYVLPILCHKMSQGPWYVANTVQSVSERDTIYGLGPKLTQSYALATLQ